MPVAYNLAEHPPCHTEQLSRPRNKPTKGGAGETGSYISGAEGEDFLHTLVIFFSGNQL